MHAAIIIRNILCIIYVEIFTLYIPIFTTKVIDFCAAHHNHLNKTTDLNLANYLNIIL